jgi:hypothetical protein
MKTIDDTKKSRKINHLGIVFFVFFFLNCLSRIKRQLPITWTVDPTYNTYFIEKSLKIPKGQSESVYRRRTDNTMAKRKRTKGQTTINKTYI